MSLDDELNELQANLRYMEDDELDRLELERVDFDDQIISLADIREENNRARNQPEPPPHHTEAERFLLGILLTNSEIMDKICGRVNANDFYYHHHREIFTEIENLTFNRQLADIINVSYILEKKERLTAIGGFAYLAELAKNNYTFHNVQTYADIVRDAAIRRKLLQKGDELRKAAHLPRTISSTELIEQHMTSIQDIYKETNMQNKTTKKFGDVLDDLLAQMEEEEKNGTKAKIASSGFQGLDAVIHGLRPSELIILAARPSLGKTSLAMNICQHLATNADKPIIVFSLEMSAKQLMLRALSSASGVSFFDLSNNTVPSSKKTQLERAINELSSGRNLYINDSGAIKINEICQLSHAHAREHGGIKAIMIDYIQLITPSERRETRTLELGDISSSLKSLAKDLEVPVIALSQLNRGVENRADKRPTLSDLRDSGAIEQDADLIMMLYRDEKEHNQNPLCCPIEVIITKHRNGPTGVVTLQFDKEKFKFCEQPPMDFNNRYDPRGDY